MNILPTGTQLGQLELLEVYEDLLGAKCFSVNNEVSFHHSEELYIASIYSDGVGKPAKVELVRGESKRLVSLPPINFKVGFEGRT